MIYVIYHIDTTLAIKHLNTFESGAKRSVTCMNRNAGSIQYAYASLEDYETKVVTTKKVKSLMTQLFEHLLKYLLALLSKSIGLPIPKKS